MSFLQSAASHVTDWLVRGGGIAAKDREIYEYGLDKLFSMITCLIFTFLLGVVVGVRLPSVIFFAAYFVLRVYAGGYHADTQLRCFFISIGIMMPALLVIRFQQAWCSPARFGGLLVLGIAILVGLAPVENKEKLLDALEKSVYRRRLLINLLLISVLSVILFLMPHREYGVAVLCGILLASAMAVAGKVKLLLTL